MTRLETICETLGILLVIFAAAIVLPLAFVVLAVTP